MKTNKTKTKKYDYVVDSNYNHEVWEDKWTFVSPCICKYCKCEFNGKFVEAVHEDIVCPGCGRTLSWSER